MWETSRPRRLRLAWRRRWTLLIRLLQRKNRISQGRQIESYRVIGGGLPGFVCCRPRPEFPYGSQGFYRACPANPTGSVESTRSRCFHAGILEFSGADLLFRCQGIEGLAGGARSLPGHVREPRPRDGETGFLPVTGGNARVRCRLRARGLATHDV